MRSKMRYLAESVYTRICPARAVHHDFFLCDFRGGFVQCALNCGDFGLHLPAMKVRAVVGNGQLDIPHTLRQLSHAESERQRAHAFGCAAKNDQIMLVAGISLPLIRSPGHMCRPPSMVCRVTPAPFAHPE